MIQVSPCAYQTLNLSSKNFLKNNQLLKKKKKKKKLFKQFKQKLLKLFKQFFTTCPFLGDSFL